MAKCSKELMYDNLSVKRSVEIKRKP